MTFIQILEELSDISTHNRLYHRTNALALIDILESGALEGFIYIGTPENNAISTARKSSFTRIDRGDKKFSKELSTEIGKIQFNLFTDRIIGSHITRNVKRKKIAELPLSMEERIEERLENLNIKGNKKILIRKLSELYRNRQFSNSNVSKILGIEANSFITGDLLNSFSMLEKLILNRESEERFISPYRRIIPLDKRLLEIELLKGFYSEYKDLLSPDRIKLKKLIKQNEDLFVKNKEFQKVME